MRHVYLRLPIYRNLGAALLLTLLLGLNALQVRAQATPPRKVVLQAFWWDYWNNNYPQGWANYVADLAPRLKQMGIEAVWVPPTIKNNSRNNGYAPFDHYDLGDKFQRDNATGTRLGTKDELLRMVAVLHANGIDVIQDIVPNHVIGAGSNNGSGGRDRTAWDDKFKNFRYVSYATPATTQDSVDYFSRSGRWPKNWQNFHPNPDHNCNGGNWCEQMFGPDVCFYSGAIGQSSNVSGFNPPQSSNHMRNGMRDWLIWYKKQEGFDGVRIDAVKHFPAWATEDFVGNLQNNAGWASGGWNMFAVGEYVGGKAELDRFCNDPDANVGVQNRVGTFDFGLRGFQTDGFRGVVSAGGSYNLGSLFDEQQTNRLRTVPFVNNHDTFRPKLTGNGDYLNSLGDDNGWNLGDQLGKHIDPRDPRLSLCYAVALAVDGSPQIFFEDLFDIGTTGKRYSHVPTSSTDLPVRSDLENLLWCRQNLRFMDGAYQERWRANDLFVIDRVGKALIAVNDNWNTWQNQWVQTGFAPGTRLKDYSGANGTAERQVDSNGWVQISVPPCDGTALLGRRGYAVWAPVGINSNFSLAARTTTQEWEMADDLGDSHCQSLGQGGRLPDFSTNQRIVGKIYVQAGQPVTYELFPTVGTNSATLGLYDRTGARLAVVSGAGSLTGTYTPTVLTAGWLTLKVRNTAATYAGQRCFVKATYTAPATVNTLAAPRATNTVAIWTGNRTADPADCGNWEGGLLPSATTDVRIPAGSMFAPTLAGTTLLARNLTIESGATITLASGGTLLLTGNLVSEGTISGSGTLELSGGATQTIGGTGLTVENLTISNPASVSLLAPVSVTNTLTFSAGHLLLGDQNLTLGPNATVVGASASQYLVTKDAPGSGGYLVAPAATGAIRLYPVGTAASYTPLTVENTGSTGAEVRVRVFSGVLENGSSGAPYSRVSEFVNRTWDITPATPGTLQARLTFQWTSADENAGFRPNWANVYHHNGTRWEELPTVQVFSPYTVTAANVSSFSPFAVGAGSTPLPVTLTDFRAERRGTAVQLRWSTAQEKDNAHFDVEKSVDGRTFRRIGQVKGLGTTSQAQSYQLTDSDAAHTAYYRLRQVDTDGTFSYSLVRAVPFSGQAAGSLTLAPNPAARSTTLSGAEPGAPVQVLDAVGRPVLRATAGADGTARLVLPAALPAGVYLVRSGARTVRLAVE
ncbi:DUF1939 domain-containing protein [Hymenobacter sp. BT175]|uniref:alpha-amylase domain-containing protein n=1 Tax=Hymenobacter translucens TaxID=2886507 RepID=UPI001D0EBF75|nr:alpha-amylase domain-containing protein [Hymenobacter translucens]MCC2545568.1 DUF1939 domain-containing protein [Hymenobacter translucens]